MGESLWFGDGLYAHLMMLGMILSVWALGMLGPWRVPFRRELLMYFTTPVGYSVLVLFIFFIGFLFLEDIFSKWVLAQANQSGVFAKADFRPGGILWVCILAIPAIASRGFAHDREHGTLSLMLSSPHSSFIFVASKYLGALFIFVVGLLVTYPIPLFIESNITKNGLDWGAVQASYLGSLLMGSSFLCVGIFINTVVRRQVTALFTTTIIIFLLVAMSLVSEVPGESESSHIRDFSIYFHSWPLMADSIVYVRDIVFHFSVLFFFLFGSFVILESRRR